MEDGETKTLSVSATNDREPITYQWYTGKQLTLNSGSMDKIEGATETQYTTEPIHKCMHYLCLAADEMENNALASFYVSIDTNLSVQPGNGLSDVSVKKGERASLFVVASCDQEPLTYQWYKAQGGDGLLLSGATSPEYTTEPMDQDTSYVCEVIDPIGNRKLCYIRVHVDNDSTAVVSEDREGAEVSSGESQSQASEANNNEPVNYELYYLDDQDFSSFDDKVVEADGFYIIENLEDRK